MLSFCSGKFSLVKNLICLVVMFSIMATNVGAQTVPVYTEKPHYYDFIPNVFSDLNPYLETASIRDNWKTYLEIAGLTGVLLYYDQDIVNGSQRFAKRLNIITNDTQAGRSRRYPVTKVGGIQADLCLPDDLNSYFYFVGDGLTSLSIIGGLALFGSMESDNRALNTASQVMESMALTGVFVITGKYTFGRESPNKATEPGGVWRPMPGAINYLKHVSTFDAFPSGHVATATSTLMILHYNYPDKAWLMPAGYSAISLLMFSMLNNGVHWAGDYPLGIAIGYVAAKTVYEMRKPQTGSAHGGKTDKYAQRSFNMYPFASPQGVGLMVDIRR